MTRKPYWVEWWGAMVPDYAGPWWPLFWRATDNRRLNGAAVMAKDPEHAKMIIAEAHDVPRAIDFYGVKEMPPQWDPFDPGALFDAGVMQKLRRAPGMLWPWPLDEEAKP